MFLVAMSSVNIQKIPTINNKYIIFKRTRNVVYKKPWRSYWWYVIITFMMFDPEWGEKGENTKTVREERDSWEGQSEETKTGQRSSVVTTNNLSPPDTPHPRVNQKTLHHSRDCKNNLLFPQTKCPDFRHDMIANIFPFFCGERFQLRR